MRALVTVFYQNPGSGIGFVPDAKVVEGINEKNFVSTLQLFMMGCQSKGHTITSHLITLLPEEAKK